MEKALRVRICTAAASLALAVGAVAAGHAVASPWSPAAPHALADGPSAAVAAPGDDNGWW